MHLISLLQIAALHSGNNPMIRDHFCFQLFNALKGPNKSFLLGS